MHRFSLKYLHLKVFEVKTSGIKHGKFLKKRGKKIWREFNLADAKFR